MPNPYPSLSSSPATFDFGNGLGVNVNVTSFSVDSSSPEHDPNLAARLARIKASGFDLVRVQIVHWLHDNGTTVLDPANFNSIKFSSNIELLFDVIANAGLRACVSVYGPRLDVAGTSTTGLGNESNFYIPYPGDPIADRFALFAGMIAKRGEEMYPGRWMWECGNEPNLETFAIPAPSVEGYLYGLWQFGSEIKARTKTAARPGGAYVVGLPVSRAGTEKPNTNLDAALLSPSPLEWARALAEHPAAAVIDAVGPHPYSDFKLNTGGQTIGYFPEEESPLRVVADLEAMRQTLSAPKYRTSATPIAIVPTEWGGSSSFMHPCPLPGEIPAYTAVLGTTQRLKGTADFSTGWNRYQGNGDLGTLDPAETGHSSAIHIGQLRNAGLGQVYHGYHAHLIQGPSESDLGLAPGEDRWFGFAFEAQSDPLDVDGRGARITAGREYSKTNFELTTEWKTYSGAFLPRGRNSGVPPFEFSIRSVLPGQGYRVRDVRVFDLTGDTGDASPRREAVQAEFLGDIGRAARAAGCPAVFAYNWRDDQGKLPESENHYGLTRTNDTVKPALPALVRNWNADPEFDPGELGTKLAAWYDAGFSLSRFKTATGAEMAGAGDPLGRLEDLSGHGRHLVRYDNDARRPTLVAGANGRLKAVFNGTNSFMRTAIGPYDLTQPFLIGALSVPAGGGDYATVLGILAVDGSVRFVLRNRAVARLQVLALRGSYYVDADLNATRGTALRVLAVANPPSGVMLDGRAFATTDPVPVTEPNRLLVVGGNIDGGVTSAIHLGEMMLLDGTPDVPTLARIVGYLERKWGL